jgi:Glycosyl transferase family 2
MTLQTFDWRRASVADVARHPVQRPLIDSPEVTDLRARLGQQEQVIDELQREVSWLIDELVRKDGNGTSGGAPDSYADDGLPPGWRPMLHGLRRLVYRRLPQGSRLAVVSSGVEPLVRYAGYRAEHLSQNRRGEHTGSHPTCGRVAVVQLEAARWRGAEFLVIPHSELWWLDHYPELANQLEHRYMRVAEEEDAGVIWDLRTAGPLREAHDLLAGLSARVDHRPTMLDWHTGHDLSARFEGYKVFSPLGAVPALPYLDETVDVVAVGGETIEYVSEARRVASALVIHIAPEPHAAIDVLWHASEPSESWDTVSIAVATSDGRPSISNFVARLLDTLPTSFTGEVIVDAACGDMPRGSRSSSRRRPRGKLVRCRQGDDLRDRLRRCASAASGDTLVFVDGSTWPTPGWLRSLVAPLRDRTVGFVTGRSVGPDGRLLGPRVLKEGPDAVAEAGLELDAPRHTRVRRLDETSAGFFATRRRLLLEWAETSAAVPDVSRAFTAYLTARGRTVVYEPEAIAISAASSAGLDLERGHA